MVPGRLDKLVLGVSGMFVRANGSPSRSLKGEGKTSEEDVGCVDALRDGDGSSGRR